jgi:prevent-host-death family protein
MKHAKVSELKAHLGSYLADVKRGETIVVSDRTTPIARLVPYESDDDDGIRLMSPTRPIADLLRLKPVRTRKRVDVVRMLRQDRDQR